jgi:hypothetical protein
MKKQCKRVSVHRGLYEKAIDRVMQKVRGGSPDVEVLL